jgi:hypothetical protein
MTKSSGEPSNGISIGRFPTINYRIHTDAIKEQIIPKEVTQARAAFVYASEAD